MTSIYLDQNVYGHLLDSSDWKKHDVGAVLVEYPEIEVWVSPAHVIELSLTTDRSRRTALARLMLEFCGAKRTPCVRKDVASMI